MSALLHVGLFAVLWRAAVTDTAKAEEPRNLTWDFPLELQAPPDDIAPPLAEAPPEEVIEDWAPPSQEMPAEVATVDPVEFEELQPPSAIQADVARDAGPREWIHQSSGRRPRPVAPMVASSRPVSPTPPSMGIPSGRRGTGVARPVPDPHNAWPSFPAEAVERGDRGVVVVKITVSGEGVVVDAQVEQSSGSDVLDHVAVEAVRGWTFRPATRDGQPVAAILRQSFRFA